MLVRRLIRYGLVALIACLPLATPPARAAEPNGGSFNLSALGLARMSEQVPLKALGADGSYGVRLTLDGADVELVLQPYSLRSPVCEAVVEGPGGARTKIDLPPSTTYRGTVRGGARGVVAASIDGDRLRARILLDDGNEWYVQPLPAGLGGAHAVYRVEDVAEAGGACAAEGAPEATREPLAAPGAQSSGCVDADLAIEAEYGYYAWCGGTSTATINDIDAVVNALELIYARDVKIGYRITTYLIQTTSGKYSAGDASTKMNQFQTWWNANQGSVTRDLAHLMTGPLNSGQLGNAYFSVLCNTSQAYGVSYTYWTSNWANRVAVMAHEIGHNWGATHCNGQPDCAIMCPNIGGCSTDMTRFSPGSIREIETYRTQSGACLASGSGTPTALPPTARNDRAVALRGTAATINVLANDFDPNCQTITVGSYATPTANGGSVSASGDNLVYTPPAGFTGQDTFTYTVRDAGGEQSSATVTVAVQDHRAPDVATGATAGLQVRYYYVPPLDGSLGSMPPLSSPFQVETVPTLSIPATTGTVGESGLSDKVAARCTGTLTLPSTGTYTFYLTASDGAKLYIDGSLRVDNDGLHDVRERSASVSLTAGDHAVDVDYYEETGTAALILELAGPGIARSEIPASLWGSAGVQVAYFKLDSSIMPPLAAMVPERTQAITTISYPFSWGNFAGSNRAINVGAVFEGFLTVPADNIYYFEVTSEDGSKFWIGEDLVVDNDGYHNRVAATGGRALRAGPHKFRLEYFARDGGNALQIQVWSSSLAKQTVPASWWSRLPTYHVPTDYANIATAVAAAPAGSMVWVAAGTYTGTGNKNLDLGGKKIALVGGGGPSLTILDAQNSGRVFRIVGHAQPEARIEGFTIANANNPSGIGGAMYFENSSLIVRDCYIEGNRNAQNGGAIGIAGNSSPVFDACVISGNHSDAAGGAIHAESSSRPSLIGTTVSANYSDAVGGGVHATGGATISFERSILWGNVSMTSGHEAWTGDATATIAFACSDVRSTGLGGLGLETLGADNIISDPGFCAPGSGARAPTLSGSYRVVPSSPVLSGVTPCGQQIGARGPGCSAGAITAVESAPGVLAGRLEQNAPNPFNPTTRIAFTVPRGGPTTLTIYDVAGRLVATLVDRDLPAGQHEVSWHGTDGLGRRVATGVYFYRLRSSGTSLTRSMVLLK
ncbi:MAG TPA: PA14 domain-containing protein [Acidobacteriota bacterium]|nr:PA14 domain-containing protein [Acidobacteriota bacterium]